MASELTMVSINLREERYRIQLRIGGETRMFWIKVTHSEINGQPLKCVAAGDRELEVAVPCGGQRAAIYKMVARQDNRPFLPLPVKVKGE